MVWFEPEHTKAKTFMNPYFPEMTQSDHLDTTTPMITVYFNDTGTIFR